MKSLLLQLYNGSISPAEQYVPKTEEYRKMRQEHFHHYESFIKILEKLEPPQHEQFIKIIDEQLDTVPLEFSAMFIDGFRLDARMMVEVYQHDFSDEQE